MPFCDLLEGGQLLLKPLDFPRKLIKIARGWPLITRLRKLPGRPLRRQFCPRIGLGQGRLGGHQGRIVIGIHGLQANQGQFPFRQADEWRTQNRHQGNILGWIVNHFQQGQHRLDFRRLKVVLYVMDHHRNFQAGKLLHQLVIQLLGPRQDGNVAGFNWAHLAGGLIKDCFVTVQHLSNPQPNQPDFPGRRIIHLPFDIVLDGRIGGLRRTGIVQEQLRRGARIIRRFVARRRVFELSGLIIGQLAERFIHQLGKDHVDKIGHTVHGPEIFCQVNRLIAGCFPCIAPVTR